MSGIGTIAAANVVPGNRPPDESYFVVSMYARWMMPRPITGSPWSVGASDVSAHRIVFDLSAFIGLVDASKHRALAAGDLNMIYGANADSLSLVERERTVWAQMEALGLRFDPARTLRQSIVRPSVKPTLDERNQRLFSYKFGDVHRILFDGNRNLQFSSVQQTVFVNSGRSTKKIRLLESIGLRYGDRPECVTAKSISCRAIDPNNAWQPDSVRVPGFIERLCDSAT